MMLMILTSLLIVIAKELPQCEAINILEHGLSAKGILTSTVEGFSKSIKDAGLDPLRGMSQNINNTNIIPVNITLTEFSSDGLSNIVVKKADFNLFATSLDFDIVMPSINMTLGNTSISANVISNQYTMEAGVKIELTKLRFVGKVKFALAITSGITVEEFTLHFALGDFKPDAKLIVQGDDYSETLKTFLVSIPTMITQNADSIDRGLAKFLKNYVTQLLSSAF